MQCRTRQQNKRKEERRSNQPLGFGRSGENDNGPTKRRGQGEPQAAIQRKEGKQKKKVPDHTLQFQTAGMLSKTQVERKPEYTPVELCPSQESSPKKSELKRVETESEGGKKIPEGISLSKPKSRTEGSHAIIRKSSPLT